MNEAYFLKFEDMKFNKTYFLMFLAFFVTEALIAIYLKDGFIRHTFGDFLVVIMLYCFLKSFINIRPVIMALIVLGIAFIIEFLQLTPFLETLGLQEKHYAKLILGNMFHISDLVAYTLGILTIIIFEYKRTTV